jgi:hypothetical protein
MVKVKKALFTILVTLGLLTGFATTFQDPVMASSWRTGTPAKIRGHYITTNQYPNLPMRITKHAIQWKSSLRVWHGSDRGKYRVIKPNWYQLKFIFSQTGQPDYYIVHYVNKHRLHFKERQSFEKHYARMTILAR